MPRCASKTKRSSFVVQTFEPSSFFYRRGVGVDELTVAQVDLLNLLSAFSAIRLISNQRLWPHCHRWSKSRSWAALSFPKSVLVAPKTATTSCKLSLTMLKMRPIRMLFLEKQGQLYFIADFGRPSILDWCRFALAEDWGDMTVAWMPHMDVHTLIPKSLTTIREVKEAQAPNLLFSSRGLLQPILDRFWLLRKGFHLPIGRRA